MIERTPFHHLTVQLCEITYQSANLVASLRVAGLKMRLNIVFSPQLGQVNLLSSGLTHGVEHIPLLVGDEHSSQGQVVHLWPVSGIASNFFTNTSL